MTTYKYWKTNQGEYLLEINSDVLNFLEFECSKVNGRETGGILLGYYSDDSSTAIITEATIPPRDSSCGYNWFQRGIAGLKSLLIHRWKNSSRRIFYIGEWHFHPAQMVIPSSEDYKQMQEISNSENYQCKEPIMLIIGNRINSTRHIRVFVFPCGGITREYYPTEST